jgi:hypothetical protein
MFCKLLGILEILSTARAEDHNENEPKYLHVCMPVRAKLLTVQHKLKYWMHYASDPHTIQWTLGVFILLYHFNQSVTPCDM